MKIALLGDIAFFGKYSAKNSKDVFNYFKSIAHKLQEYDLVIGNFETPFVTSKMKPFGYKSAYINSDICNVDLLKFLNISVVNLANNHMYDYGKPGYELTKNTLMQNGIKYFGVENTPLNINYDNNQIVLDGFCCYSTNPLGVHPGGGDAINELDYAVISKRLLENYQEGLYSIFSVHCGLEHVNYPSADHIQLARKLADIAPYAFYGHHPHVAQGFEKVHDSLIAYSLGNFCFDDVYTSKSEQPLIKQSENNKEAYIMELHLDNNKLIEFKPIPIYLGKDEMIFGDSKIFDKLKKYSEKLVSIDDKYIQDRQELLNNYIHSRKTARDLSWYLKRLNMKSVLQLLSARENSKKYYIKITKQVWE